MFTTLGRFSVRFAVPIMAFWLVATALSVHFLTSLSNVKQTQEAAFLPLRAPSVQAAGLARPFQPPDVATSTLVAADRGGPLTSPDLAVIDHLKDLIRALPSVTT